ncbi:hypothetical protein Ciccas_002741 [Cichlidogyrus casuarinus]|uniref:Uncharacterized protein n=1 Tax=Cichlidogyrus casuarinus TaxID=1844966 RepID=A0ABD2QGD1_9PLAT
MTDTDLLYRLDLKPTNKEGYALGGRKAIRFVRYVSGSNLAPGIYQDYLIRKPDRCKCKGMIFSGSRPETKIDNGPSVGSYFPDKDKMSTSPRQVKWQYDTQGRPINLPNISQKSTITANTSKLESTVDERKYQRKLEYLKLFFPTC